MMTQSVLPEERKKEMSPKRDIYTYTAPKTAGQSNRRKPIRDMLITGGRAANESIVPQAVPHTIGLSS